MDNKIKEKEFKIVGKKLKDNYTLTKRNCPVCGSDTGKELFLNKDYGFSLPSRLCSECGLIYLYNIPSPENYIDFYEKHYRKLYYGENTIDPKRFEQDIKRGENIISLFKKEITKDIEGKTILEIGCGVGGALKAFKQGGLIPTGIDLEPKCVEEIKSMGLNAMLSSLERYSLDTEKKYDIIVLSDVLEHLWDPLSELKLVKKLMHKESILYINIPNLITSTLRGKSVTSLTHIAHITLFSKSTLLNIMSQAGFENVFINDRTSGLFKLGEETPYKKLGEQELVVYEILEKVQPMRQRGVVNGRKNNKEKETK